MFGGIRTFEQIMKDLEEAIALVQSQLGRQINSTCRVMEYLRDVAELERTWRTDAGKAAIAERGHRRLVNSAMEADVLGFVTKLVAEKIKTDRLLLEKLEQCFYGPTQAEDEKAGGSIKARNFFFEMRLLGQLIYAKLPAISGEHPDVQTEIAGKPVLIECKRAFSRNSLRSLASKARDQLDRELKSNPAAVGFIAFDFTRILPSDRWYVLYRTRQEMIAWFTETQEYIKESFEPDIISALRNKAHQRAVGIIEYFQIAGHNLSTGRWGTSWSEEFVPLREGTSKSIVKDLYRIINKAHTADRALIGA
jgi:hypothetical protein